MDQSPPLDDVARRNSAAVALWRFVRGYSVDTNQHNATAKINTNRALRSHGMRLTSNYKNALRGVLSRMSVPQRELYKKKLVRLTQKLKRATNDHMCDELILQLEETVDPTAEQLRKFKQTQLNIITTHTGRALGLPTPIKGFTERISNLF